MGPHTRPAVTHRWVSFVPLLAYALFVGYQSLVGGGDWACGGEFLLLPRRFSRSDVLANVVAYVPLGWLCAVWLGASARSAGLRTASLLVSVVLVSGMSLGLEMVQSCQAGRVSSAVDWAANSAGGAIGVLAAILLPALARALEPARALSRDAHGTDARLRLGAMAVVVLWVLSQCMPWAFAVDVGTFRRNLSFLRHWDAIGSMEGWRLLRHCGAWVAVAAACRLAAASRSAAATGLLAAAGASIGLQLMLDARAPLSYDELLAMGAVLLAFVPLMALRRRPSVATWWPLCQVLGVAAVIVGYELAPADGPTRAFSWIPLVGLGGRLGALDFAWLFAWAGCGTVVAARFAQRQNPRSQLRRWPVLMVVLVLILEVTQTHIPGRGPDTSAVLFLTLSMLATLALGDDR